MSSLRRGPWPGSGGSSLDVEVAAHLPLLPELAAQLSETSRQIEEAVTDVCGTFQAMVARAQASVAQAEAVAGMGGQAGGPRLLETLASARHSFDVLLDRLSSASERARSGADRVRALEALAVKVEKGIAQVDSIAMSVRLLALNAKIEAARDGDRSAGFSVVATEMERCAGQSSDIADSIRTTARELTTTLSGVADALRTEADAAARDMAISRAEIEAALRDVEHAHETIRTQLADAGHLSRDFAREISSAVISLQFQDRVSQRVAHVVEALTEMHRAIDAVCGPVPARLEERVRLRRDEVARRVSNTHTMVEERQVTTAETGSSPAPVASGDVELF